MGDAGREAAAPNLDPPSAIGAQGEPKPAVPLPLPDGIPWLALGAAMPALAGAVGLALHVGAERRAAVRYAQRRQWLGAASAAAALVAAALTLRATWRARHTVGEVDMDEEDPPLFV